MSSEFEENNREICRICTEAADHCLYSGQNDDDLAYKSRNNWFILVSVRGEFLYTRHRKGWVDYVANF